MLVMGCGIVTISTGIIFICLTCKEPDLFHGQTCPEAPGAVRAS